MNKLLHVSSIIGGSIVIIIGIVIQYAAFPAFVKNEVIKEKCLLNGSEALKRWKTLPMPLEYKVYLLNVTNPEEVSQGALPIVKELGPYVYDEYKHKENLSFGEDFISYSARNIYYFNKNKSGCRNEDDLVTTLNIAVMGTAMMVKQIFPPGIFFLNNAIPFLFPGIKNIFWTVRVKDLLFDGVVVNCSNPLSITICNGLSGSAPNTLRRLSSGDYLFSFFNHKNNTVRGPFVVNRGIHNISNLGQISSFEGKTELDVWQPNSSCSKLRGTDSTIYHPFFSRDNVIYIFEPDVCASLSAIYQEDIQKNGLNVMRFVSSPENFGDPAEYEASRCRCKFKQNSKNYTCHKPGVIDLTQCQGVPVITSLPHFYLADTTYKSYVEGLTPSKPDHETYIDMEPVTGVPLEGHKRLQMNMYLNKITGIDLLKNVSEGLFPLIWIDEGVKLNDEILGKLLAFYSSIEMMHWFSAFIIVLGCAIIIVSVLYSLYSKKLLCFRTFSNKVGLRAVFNSAPSDQNHGAEANKTSVNTSSNTPAQNSSLNLNFLSNNSPNTFSNDLQVVTRPQNINVVQS